MKHLDVLTDAKLIRRSKRGRVVSCELTAAPMEDAMDWLARYQRFWDESHERLDDLLARVDAAANLEDVTVVRDLGTDLLAKLLRHRQHGGLAVVPGQVLPGLLPEVDVPAREALEDAGEELGGNAHALIPHGETGLVLLEPDAHDDGLAVARGLRGTLGGSYFYTENPASSLLPGITAFGVTANGTAPLYFGIRSEYV